MVKVKKRLELHTTLDKETEGPITVFYGIKWECEVHFQVTLKEPKKAQLNKLLCKWFPVMCLEWKLVTGPVIIEKVKSVYDEMEITDKYTFFEV